MFTCLSAATIPHQDDFYLDHELIQPCFTYRRGKGGLDGKPLTKARARVCLQIYKTINPSLGLLVVVMRMASRQVSCFCSRSPRFSFHRLPERNVPFSCEAPAKGPLAQNYQDNMHQPTNWRLEAGDELQIPLENVYDHFSQSQELICLHHPSFTTSFFLVGLCRKKCLQNALDVQAVLSLD